MPEIHSDLDAALKEELAGLPGSDAVIDRVFAAVRAELSEPPMACGKCGRAGEFYQRWELCEDCVREVYFSGPAAAEQAVRALLIAIGENPAREGLRETPRRVAAMLAEMRDAHPFRFTAFDAEGTDEMIVQAGIPFHSLCEHHMLPFMGTAAVGYIPNGKIVGLSKLARAVRQCAAGLQNQERITRAVADLLQDQLDPRGVGVVLRARHTCMEVRGVQAHDTLTTTSAMLGGMRENHDTRAEFLALAGVRQ